MMPLAPRGCNPTPSVAPRVQGGTQSRFRFAGQEDRSDLELLHMRARWYDPAIGRFISTGSAAAPQPHYCQRLAEYCSKQSIIIMLLGQLVVISLQSSSSDPCS